MESFDSPEEAAKAAIEGISDVVESASPGITGINLMLRDELGLDSRLTVYGELVFPIDREGPDLRVEVLEADGRKFVQLDVCVAHELVPDAADIAKLANELNYDAISSRFVYVDDPRTLYALCELPLAGLISEALLIAMRQLVDSASKASEQLADRVPDLRRPLSRWNPRTPGSAAPFGKALVELDGPPDGQ